jgi:hypothetical protein
MQDKFKPGIECTEFDTLLTDAIDGVLEGEQLALFEQHRDGCVTCKALFAEVSAGADLLGSLNEVEPPRYLVHNILAATSGVASEAVVNAAAVPKRSLWERLREGARPALVPTFSARFAMSVATAFFSLTLVMNMTGLRPSDLRPHNIEHRFYSSQAKILKYYENMRVVYEFESRVRDYRRATSGTENQDNNRRSPEPRSDRDKRNSNEPEQQKERQNYTQEKTSVMLAKLPEIDKPFLLAARQRRNA